MFNITQLINETSGLADMEALTVISQDIFALPALIMLLAGLLLAFIIAIALKIEKGWGEVFVISVIPFVIMLALWYFIFVYPIIPKLLANTIKLFNWGG